MTTRALTKKSTLLLLLVAAVLSAGACGGSAGSKRTASTDGGSKTIVLEGLAFDPDVVTVSAGTKITWTNEDPVMHTVTSGTKGEQGVPGVSNGKQDRPDGLFDGALDDDGATFSFTFDEPGTYEYFCRIHGGMTGTVVVD